MLLFEKIFHYSYATESDDFFFNFCFRLKKNQQKCETVFKQMWQR